MGWGGCCGRPATASGSRGYVYVAEDGTETVKATEVEALAMKVRAGGKGTVRPR